MIFYFSGTGNSLFAAKRLLAEGESLINIADAVKQEVCEYDVPAGEAVGIVFPVYFYTVSAIIEEFVSKLKLNNAEYVYAVITCGGGISQAGAVLKKLLHARGIKLNYVTDLLMPDNSMLFYQIPPTSAGAERLKAAEKKLIMIDELVKVRVTENIGDSTWISNLVGAGYKLSNKTAKFYADDKCIGCGLCASRCPKDVIVMKDGKPLWSKPTCLKCSACINRCPKGAIQYGNATKKRNRYVNPEG